MAHITADRVRDTTSSTGTGALTLSATPPQGYRTFSAVMATSDTCFYAIQHQSAAEWEVGIGTYSGSNQLTRTVILASSNSDNAVSLSSGTKDVFITLAASRTLQHVSAGNVLVDNAVKGLIYKTSGKVEEDIEFKASSAYGVKLGYGGNLYDDTTRTRLHAGGDKFEVFDEAGTNSVLAADYAAAAPTFKGQAIFHEGNIGPRRHGECRLVYTDGSTVTLLPYNGDRIIIDGVERAIPQAGVSLANTGMSASTLYYIYASWSGTDIVLQRSASSPVLDANGVTVATSNADWTLVGRVRTGSGSGFSDSATQRGVASWFNRRPRSVQGSVGSGTTTSSTSYTNFGGTALGFLSWGENDVDIFIEQSINNAKSGSQAYTTYITPYIDGSSDSGLYGLAVSYDRGAVGADNYGHLSTRGTDMPASGWHTMAPYWSVAGGTAMTVGTGIYGVSNIWI